ncbi:putative NBD/HSP70 family sugar kinase [Frondihabitans sp. PhB188]|uniref:ROK family transcriptional regulator n=1 Tax=Frondihabitans sp. PhB188 TaxID=2485200 RepID=UPI000F46769C|nr:ROK family transcriptional regulator [Frondihabitans sp. PhB188]ROQ37476.1 putative NBD/HSP70 family sugar kinase [Frondihabitans sp. PhB188]
MRTGTNLPAIGGYNQAVVLDAIRRASDGLSRVELAERTGLSAQTIGNVSRRLLDEGLVRETGKVVNGPGKPRTILQLEGRGSYAVGVHIDPAVITYVVLDLRGSVVSHSRTRTPSAKRPAEVIELMARSISHLIDDSGVDRSLVLGVGIASPGPIDAGAGTVLDPPMLPMWKNVPLRAALSEATGLPVLLEKDVTAAAVAELWFSRENERQNFAFVYYGTGFGTGLVLNREAVRGSTANAGDAGHITVDPAGAVCVCGRAGCVGDLITPRSLVQQAIAAQVLPPLEPDADDPTDMAAISRAFQRLAESAGTGQPAAQLILREAGLHLARAVVVLVNLLDLDEIVFGGPFWDEIGDALLAVLPTAVETDPALIPTHSLLFDRSSIGEDVAAVGAACLVLDYAFSPRPSAMLISV